MPSPPQAARILIHSRQIFPAGGVDEEQQALLADYLPWCAIVRIPNPPPATPEFRDPFDQPFLQLAIVGKARYLASGDQDLLSLVDQFDCPIVTVDQSLETLRLRGAGQPEISKRRG